jgi:hypothetical protein
MKSTSCEILPFRISKNLRILQNSEVENLQGQNNDTMSR